MNGHSHLSGYQLRFLPQTGNYLEYDPMFIFGLYVSTCFLDIFTSSLSLAEAADGGGDAG